MASLKELNYWKIYEISEILDLFGAKKTAEMIEKGDIFKVSAGKYRVLW